MKPRFPFLALGLAALVAVLPSASAQDTHTKGPKPAHIAMGQRVVIADYVVPGKTTIFDFTSEYCPPCRAIAPKLDALHAKRDDIAVVKVDINRPGVKGIDWRSPVATQYKMQSIPNFKVFGPDGKLVAEGEKAGELVRSWLK
ncbi:MAG TPA: thioredoxin family protein [Opitutaceae bacterium]|nr:thioredoxin family protein [Opitutaceae bacterium]